MTCRGAGRQLVVLTEPAGDLAAATKRGACERDERDRDRQGHQIPQAGREHRQRHPVDDPEHRVIPVPVGRPLDEQRGGAGVGPRYHRHRHERDERETKRPQGRRREQRRGRGAHVALGIASLNGKIADGLHPRVGDARDGEGEQQPADGRRGSHLQARANLLGTEHEHQPEQQEQHLDAEVEHAQETSKTK